MTYFKLRPEYQAEYAGRLLQKSVQRKLGDVCGGDRAYRGCLSVGFGTGLFSYAINLRDADSAARKELAEWGYYWGSSHPSNGSSA